MTMHNPPHSGEILQDDVLPALTRVLHSRVGISPQMAFRIERWLGVKRSGRAEVWAGMQLDYDYWRERHGKAA